VSSRESRRFSKGLRDALATEADAGGSGQNADTGGGAGGQRRDPKPSMSDLLRGFRFGISPEAARREREGQEADEA
jgi:hypothetical protein